MRGNRHPASRVETITPALAAKILLKNQVNRPIRIDKVAQMARDLSGGRWQLTGDQIVLDADGNLIQGQHRLSAVVKSGVPMTTYVVRGIRREAMLAMDIGTARTAGDQFAVKGYPQAQRVAAAAAIVWRGRRGLLRSNNARPSLAELMALVEEHPSIVDSVRLCKGTEHVIGTGIMAGLHFLFAEKDRVMADWFVRRLELGDDLPEGSPVLALRNRLLLKDRMPVARQLALVIKAWNLHLKGKHVKRLTWNEQGTEEPFPEIR